MKYYGNEDFEVDTYDGAITDYQVCNHILLVHVKTRIDLISSSDILFNQMKLYFH